MSKTIAMIVGVVLLVALVLFSMTFTVRFNEVAIQSRFGKADINSVVDEPGLHFRLPLFADTITTIDKRLQLRESPLLTIPTQDSQQVVVRAFLMWQVDTSTAEGPLKFYMSYPSGVEDANNSISDQFNTAIRTGLSRFTFDDLIGTRSRLADAEKAIRDEMMTLTSRGIQPVSVGISQLLLPPNTTRAVLGRMQATRSYLSEAERYKGNAEASGIENRAKAQAEKIGAFAMQLAEEIRAEGNRGAAIYLERMGEDQGLAIFLSWLEALEAGLSSRTTFVVPTAFAPFHLLRLDTMTNPSGIPQPLAENGRDLSTQPSAATAQDDPAKQAPVDETPIQRETSANRGGL